MAPASKEVTAAASPNVSAEKGTDLTMGWGFWATLCILASAGLLVNQLENPFARTLISCDTPIGETFNNTETPLSTKCGNRLTVVGEGARLSARAQSFEHFCKMFMAVLVANVANIVGRKPLVLLAMGSVWVSVLLFVLASIFDGVAPQLFSIAQGIQGLAAGDMLVNIVFADLAMTMGAKGTELYIQKDQLLGLVMFATYMLSQVVTGLELLDYRLLWLCVLCLLSFGWGVCALHFPETMTKKDDGSQQLGFAQRLGDELKLYKTMFAEKPVVCWCLFDAFLSGLAQDSAGAMWAPLMIAYFGYTQLQLVLRVVPLNLLTETQKGLANKYCQKVGYVRGFYHVTTAFKCAGFTFIPLSICTWWMAWATRIVFIPLAGFSPLWLNVRARLVGAEMTPKLESLQFLVWCGGQAIGSQIHAVLFNEYASTAWARFMSGGLYMGGISFITWAIFQFKIYPASLEVLASMDAEMAASPESAAAGDARLDAKKTD